MTLSRPQEPRAIGREHGQHVGAFRFRHASTDGLFTRAGRQHDFEDLVVSVANLTRRVDKRLAVRAEEWAPVHVLVRRELRFIRNARDRAIGSVDEIRHEHLQQVVAIAIGPVANLLRIRREERAAVVAGRRHDRGALSCLEVVDVEVTVA